MTERKIQALREKVTKEKEEYTKEILSLSKEEIFSKAYEISVIEEFFLWLTAGGIDCMMKHTEQKGQIFRALENTSNLLKTLQQKELEYDIPMSHDWEDIEEFINNFVDSKEENDMNNNSRKEIYNELISQGHQPHEIWALMENMDFAEDYED